jgi:hypothetical protein
MLKVSLITGEIHFLADYLIRLRVKLRPSVVEVDLWPTKTAEAKVRSIILYTSYRESIHLITVAFINIIIAVRQNIIICLICR